MNCGQIIKENVAEKYLTGGLSESEQDAFERHYFECSSCFGELEKYRLVQQALRHSEAYIRQESPTRGWGWRWRWATAAAVIVFAVGLGIWLGPHQLNLQIHEAAPKTQPPPQAMTPTSLSQLAQFEPPAYTPPVLRGEGNTATQRFRSAMLHYEKKDYIGAIPGLRQAVALDPNAPDSRFFLGICYLLIDQTKSAVATLNSVVALGESAYLEDAHFYLAKAYVREGDFSSAKLELVKTIELAGDRQLDARQLLEKLQRTGDSR